jgi:hypothetical protein
MQRRQMERFGSFPVGTVLRHHSSRWAHRRIGSVLSAVAVKQRPSGALRLIARAGGRFATRDRLAETDRYWTRWSSWHLLEAPSPATLPYRRFDSGGSWVVEDQTPGPSKGRLTLFLWQVLNERGLGDADLGSVLWSCTQTDAEQNHWGPWTATNPFPVSDQGHHFRRITPAVAPRDGHQLLVRLNHLRGLGMRLSRGPSGWGRDFSWFPGFGIGIGTPPDQDLPISGGPVALVDGMAVSVLSQTWQYSSPLGWRMLDFLAGHLPVSGRESPDLELFYYDGNGVLVQQSGAGSIPLSPPVGGHGSQLPIVAMNDRNQLGILLAARNGTWYFRRQNADLSADWADWVWSD